MIRRVLVTGSSGHLGEALVRTLRDRGTDVVGVDVRPSEWTDVVGSIADGELTRAILDGVDAVLHTATLHKPQVAFLPAQAFVDVNVTGTLTLLESAANAGVRSFVMTSSTTVFGDALIPAPAAPAAWIDESVVPVTKNIYGATKAAAEDLCRLASRNRGLPCVVLRTSRFLPEADDSPDPADGRGVRPASARDGCRMAAAGLAVPGPSRPRVCQSPGPRRARVGATIRSRRDFSARRVDGRGQDPAGAGGRIEGVPRKFVSPG
jgi:nucleoside-diphosphate-sugar epimerase